MRLDEGHVLQGGIWCYQVTEVLKPSAGARGFAYKAKVISEGASTQLMLPGKRVDPPDVVFLKTPHVEENAPYAVKHENLAGITGDFMAQFTKHQSLIDLAQEIAYVFDWGWTPIKDYSLPFLAQRFVSGVTLRAFLGRDGNFEGVVDADHWFELALSISELVRRLHNRGLVHGDISPDNIIIEETGARAGKPTLVDFGESVLYSHEVSGRGGSVDAPGTTRYRYQAPERRTPGQRWEYPADIYSLGAVFYFMATGEDPSPAMPEEIHTLKQQIYSQIKQRNEKLLSSSKGAGAAKIIDKCLRQQQYERYAYVESLERALVLFSREKEHEINTATIEEVAERCEETAALIRKNFQPDDPFFPRLAMLEVERTRKRLETMSKGHVEIVGEREELIDSLLEYLGALSEGDEYLTITAPQLWTDDNLGINGRFLTMNKILAQEGVVIRRIFTLCENDRNDPVVEAILRSHVDMMSDLPEYVSTDNSDSGGPRFYTGFVEISPDERRTELTLDRPVAVWKRHDAGSDVSISFALRPASISSRDYAVDQATPASASIGDRVIGKVRFWWSKSGESAFDSFLAQINKSRPLAEFLDPPTRRKSTGKKGLSG